MYEDPSLPDGWTRKVSQRQGGASTGKWDVCIVRYFAIFASSLAATNVSQRPVYTSDFHGMNISVNKASKQNFESKFFFG